MKDHKRRVIDAFSALSLAVVLLNASVAVATSASAAVCSTQNVVSGSNFEIDTNANLAVNGASKNI